MNNKEESSRDLPNDVVAALSKGQKIQAIKILRSKWGIGLKEAKDAVDGHLVAQGSLPKITDTPNREQPYQPKVDTDASRLLWLIILVAAAFAAYYYS